MINFPWIIGANTPLLYHKKLLILHNLILSLSLQLISMAAIISFSLFSDPQKHQSLSFNTHLLKPPHNHKLLSFTPASSKPSHPLLLLHKFHHYYNFTPPFSSSHSSSESYLNDPPRTGGFLTTHELQKLQILQNFRYAHEFEHGSLWVRVMEEEELNVTVGLLAESFAESMSLPFRYVNLLGFLVKQYLIERRALLPNTATLIGFYRDKDGEDELAGTVEISFNKKGSNASPPSPTPPKDSPYICNMTVKKQLRRRGIGWHLLKASEELISQMRSTSREVYLHCRMIDTAPFNMYTKAGYNVIKTDNILILLTLQRRKHLMCKKLPLYNDLSESNILSLPESDILSLPESDISRLPESDISSLPESDISSLPESDISRLPESNISSLPESNISNLSESDISSLLESDMSSSEDNPVHEFPR